MNRARVVALSGLVRYLGGVPSRSAAAGVGLVAAQRAVGSIVLGPSAGSEAR
ncbi:hypothetical protein LTT66_29700 [Nocardia gipuzkoensis]|uniref:hypothetical protein n=1 Tax=Nocardia gipuzkoensis TaxID=2749991 RepID=UPI001E4AA26E|nr:hypothetical protein [Nocardia gipuzkoensis]UGT67360.1 hypothetical protein LTT66_29700 [Nocardia gipuzkoensis]